MFWNKQKIQITQLPGYDLGQILFPLVKGEVLDSEFADPDHSPLGGTPLFTYLNLIDKWFVFGKNPNFKKLKTAQDKMKFLCTIRGYTEEQINKLCASPVKNYREAIMKIIDWEFTYDNPVDPAGTTYLAGRAGLPDVLDEIDKLYLEKRDFKSID